MKELDLKELLHILLRRWWILAICAVVISGTVGYWGYYHIVPIYEANTTLYIGKNIEETGRLAENDLNIASMLVSDYREIAKSRLIASSVIEGLGLKSLSVEQMADKITVTPKNETRVIQISVQDPNPKLAMDITNEAAEVFKKKVIDIMQIENVQIIDKAVLPRNPIPSDNIRNVIIAFIAGLAVGTGIVLLINFSDNTIKTPGDIKKYADLPVIGTIPIFPK